MPRLLPLVFALVLMPAALLAAEGFRFDSIDGGTLALEDWRGGPVLVVNTASLCGFTHQYAGLQTLQDRYGDRGLVVLAVPSDDFAQELESAAEVRDFCELNYGLTLPMTTITRVRGRDAHPFYAWLRAEHGFRPRWNFDKVLLDAQGNVVDTFGSLSEPTGRRITRAVEALLPR